MLQGSVRRGQVSQGNRPKYKSQGRNLGEAFKKEGEGAEKTGEPPGKTSQKAKRGDGSQKQVVSGSDATKK